MGASWNRPPPRLNGMRARRPEVTNMKSIPNTGIGNHTAAEPYLILSWLN
jgi:hypothetical protein